MKKTLKKINVYNLKSYFRNKFYNYLANIGINKRIKNKIKNSKEIILSLKNINTDVNDKEDIEIDFKDGYKIICPKKNIPALIETCINEDYTRKFYNIESGDIVFDIGANVGSFSIFAAKKGAKVIAFEPDPYNLRYIKKNISINNLEDLVIIYPFAVSNIEGVANLSINDNHACGSIFDKTNMEKILEVNTITIDKVVEELKIDKINFLKIDVEGAEYLILKSIPNKIFDIINNIAGEFHLFKSNNKEFNYKSIKRILKPHFYKVENRLPYYFFAYKNKL